MIYVLATIEVAVGRRDEFLHEFHRIVPLVRAEEGCLDYGPAVDVETNLTAPPTVRENVVTVLEKWESIKALERHLIAPHMVQYRSQVKELVVGVSLRVLRPRDLWDGQSCLSFRCGPDWASDSGCGSPAPRLSAAADRS